MTVKTYRLGNSIVVTIPASFNIGENGEYQPIIDENGVISCYLLSIKSSRGDAGYDLRQAMLEENIGDNDIPIGREDAWHE
ncbi:AbrB family transcriptional regulator [Lacticaseibacillus rhamnosus]|nr:AbrB family transcriptional regulator [Lacticaseibacillus rhamnosus]